jgi:hypothetical protein
VLLASVRMPGAGCGLSHSRLLSRTAYHPSTRSTTIRACVQTTEDCMRILKTFCAYRAGQWCLPDFRSRSGNAQPCRHRPTHDCAATARHLLNIRLASCIADHGA